VTAPNLQQQPASSESLLGEYAGDRFDALLSPARVPGGVAPQVVAASDGPPSVGPGPEQTRVCALNPFDCPRAISARDDSYSTSTARYPTYSRVDDRRDTFRDCTWQALTTKRANAIGRQVGLENENTEDPAIYIRCGDLADTGGLRTLV